MAGADPMAAASVHQAFEASVARWAGNPFLGVLEETAAAYGIAAGEISYGAAKARVDALIAAYRAAGWGAGHRVGLLLENRPDYVMHFLAINAVGASIVPINPDLRSEELRYMIGHSEMAMAVAIPARQGPLREASAGALTVIAADDAIPEAATRREAGLPLAAREAGLLYTSGTTGLPKGCVVSNTWFLETGRWYLGLRGAAELRIGTERMLTPLPLFHMNALAASTMAMMLSGGCLFVLDRFHPRSWWKSVRESRATVIHYLGVMPAMLMAAAPTPEEREHQVRFGFGAGCDRTLHAPAEERFGFPLVEGWAMTETGCSVSITADVEPRHVGMNCLGRVPAHMEIRIVREDGGDCDVDEPGELLVRRAGADPRYGFFTEYLKDREATDAAWAGGWFHTGDVIRRDAEGFCYFVDRRKNVIRRSGENIAAIEVEAVLLRHPGVAGVAVAAVPDAMRGEEVLACVIPSGKVADAEAFARDLVAWCAERLAYYKAPGFVALVDKLPVTSTNKVQRGVLKTLAATLLDDPATVDVRALKKRAA
jgi:acyl-CoA synthetase (AMP-forming)/AMP-acid ligase II